MTSSLSDFDSSLTKIFQGITVDYDEAGTGDGGSVDIAYRLNDLDGAYTSLQTGEGQGRGGAVVKLFLPLTHSVNYQPGMSRVGLRLRRGGWWRRANVRLVEDQLVRVRQAAENVERAEKDPAAARVAFWSTLKAVHEEGLSLAAIGKEHGVTRQRVAQLIKEET